MTEGELRSDKFDGGYAVASRPPSLMLLHITFISLRITCIVITK